MTIMTRCRSSVILTALSLAFLLYTFHGYANVHLWRKVLENSASGDRAIPPPRLVLPEHNVAMTTSNAPPPLIPAERKVAMTTGNASLSPLPPRLTDHKGTTRSSIVSAHPQPHTAVHKVAMTINNVSAYPQPLTAVHNVAMTTSNAPPPQHSGTYISIKPSLCYNYKYIV